MVEHQDFAIYIIKKARNFQQEVLDAKNLSSKNKIRLSALVEDLTMQFNTLRGRQPMIMDSLLETIDSMRLMQKNYSRDHDLFSYDYKKDLTKTALERDRIFVLNKIREDTQESDDEIFLNKDEADDEPAVEM